MNDESFTSFADLRRAVQAFLASLLAHIERLVPAEELENFHREYMNLERLMYRKTELMAAKSREARSPDVALQKLTKIICDFGEAVAPPVSEMVGGNGGDDDGTTEGPCRPSLKRRRPSTSDDEPPRARPVLQTVTAIPIRDSNASSDEAK